MSGQSSTLPDTTALRVALWRAIHVQFDPPPHVLKDEIGLQLAAPEPGWRDRPDMNPVWTLLFRASIVARARFTEDLALEQAALGVNQFVILGAGLDTFAQRRPKSAPDLQIFEVDKPATQEWKRRRLIELGYGVPDYLKLVPVDFETGESWLQKLVAGGFDRKKPAVIVSTGVSLYLTEEAIKASLRQIAALAPGSTLAMDYILPMELAEPEEKIGREMAEKGARASGTPFISFFTSERVKALALQAGFKEAHCVTAAQLTERYFSSRTDGLRPPKSGEFFVAKT
jgi:methyltransferase (TIGR00027 family)